MSISRGELLSAIASTLAPLDFVLALWQGGSEAHGYTDEWSDLDLRALVADDRVDDTFAALEAGLIQRYSMRLRYRLPEPTWHGHSQCFYQLAEASPFLAIDFTVMQRQHPDRYLGVERHGAALIVFDKLGLIQDPPFDRTRHLAQMQVRLSEHQQTFALGQIFVLKEIYRGHLPSAIHNYHSLTLEPLVEVLGMLHRPDRYDYGFKYFDRDFPLEVKTQIEALICICSLDDLKTKQQQAADWFDRTLPQVQKAFPEFAKAPI